MALTGRLLSTCSASWHVLANEQRELNLFKKVAPNIRISDDCSPRYVIRLVPDDNSLFCQHHLHGVISRPCL